MKTYKARLSEALGEDGPDCERKQFHINPLGGARLSRVAEYRLEFQEDHAECNHPRNLENPEPPDLEHLPD